MKNDVSVTSEGRGAVLGVAGLRLLTSVFMAAALVALGSAAGDAIDGAAPSGSAWIVALVAGLGAALCASLEITYGGRQAREEERRIRGRILETVFRSTELPKNTKEFPSGRLISMMTDSVERVTEYRQVYFGSTMASLAVPILILIYIAIFIDPIIGMGGLIVCPLVPAVIGLFMKMFRKVSSNSRAERARLTSNYLDALRNLVTIRLYGAGPRIEKKLRDNGEANRSAIMKLLAGNQIVIIVVDGVASLLMICWLVFLTATRLSNGQIDGGEAVTVLLLLALLLEPFRQVSGFFYIGMGGRAAERSIKRYLSLRPDARQATATEVAEATIKSDTNDADAIAVDSVRYDYGRGEVLQGVSMHVKKGETAALIGGSGAGKSTLLSLLRGSLPLQEGEILLDGRNVGDMSVGEIRALTATVSQSTWLFTGTIASNLRFAKPEATEKEMWEALERANVASEVRTMPQRLHTEVGEGGSLLSGGQVQRIAIARALLSGRSILLLDEPTSHVDAESEERIIDAIEGLKGDLTILIVTHRTSLLRIADSTWEMTEGRLKEVQGRTA